MVAAVQAPEAGVDEGAISAGMDAHYGSTFNNDNAKSDEHLCGAMTRHRELVEVPSPERTLISSHATSLGRFLLSLVSHVFFQYGILTFPWPNMAVWVQAVNPKRVVNWKGEHEPTDFAQNRAPLLTGAPKSYSFSAPTTLDYGANCTHELCGAPFLLFCTEQYDIN